MQTTCPICSHPDRFPIATCCKCNKDFCYYCASSEDIRFCKECRTGLEVNITEESISRQDYDLDNDKVLDYRFKIKKISFSGNHWRFVCKYIHEMQDEDIVKMVEYYKAIAALIEQEILTRRLAKQQAQIIHDREEKTFKLSINQQPKQHKVKTQKTDSIFDQLLTMLAKHPELAEKMRNKMGGNNEQS